MADLWTEILAKVGRVGRPGERVYYPGMRHMYVAQQPAGQAGAAVGDRAFVGPEKDITTMVHEAFHALRQSPWYRFAQNVRHGGSSSSPMEQAAYARENELSDWLMAGSRAEPSLFRELLTRYGAPPGRR